MRNWLWGCSLALVLAVSLAVEYRLGSIQRALETLEELLMPDATTSTFTWTSGGITVTLTVTKAADETNQQYADRCVAEVGVMKTAFPPDP